MLQAETPIGENGLSDSESAYSLGDSLDDLEEVIPLSQRSAGSPPPLLEVDESLPASAAELLYDELSKKTKLLRIAVQEAHQFKRCYESLSAKLKSKKKRSRDEPNSLATPNVDAAPVKRPSPDPPVVPIASTAGDPSSKSDDEVALPAPVNSSADHRPKKNNKLFEQLHSILCGYKDKKIRPGSTNLPFEICVELCNDEIGRIEKEWGPAECARFHKPILSALRLVYPNKRTEWFNSPFLLDPSSAAKYWVKVLTRRSEIWQAAANKLASSASRSAAARSTSLEERIRQKIQQRKSNRILSLRAAAKASASSNPYKTPPRRPSKGLSSSDSEHEVVDLSTSPPGASASSKAKASPKMARAPGYVSSYMSSAAYMTYSPPHSALRHYTLPEMKAFKRMAKAIRNVNERDGHAESTAAFIDAHFSDNSGLTLKAMRSKVAWKKNRVNAICDKAARIMEDRRVS